jgi:diaminopimelate decarboxylase
MNDPQKTIPVRSNLPDSEMSRIVNKVLSDGNLIRPDDTALFFYDLSFINDRIKTLKAVFPENAVHAIAAKANPLSGILYRINTLGVGLEVASLPELYVAEKAGFAPQNIVFDSPCKTRAEIEYALQAGVYINADSFDELDRIAELLATTESKSKIGLRINPQVGTGSIKSTSVAGMISKFGVPLNENREQIIDCYRKYSWLKGIHVHIGSQGCPVPLLVEGIRKTLDLAIEINIVLEQESKAPVSVFDIGGGLPVSYHEGKEPVTMNQYSSILRKKCPELFKDEFRLITEFGRYIYANAGWVAAKVEYVKRGPGYNIIMTHVGADLFLRKCYNPGDWHHHITVVDKNGNPKTGIDTSKYIVAGPLCFAGDVMATDLELPLVVEGDYLLIHDTGAYTISMWSRYNSRQMPKVIGYHPGNDSFEILKERETPDDLLDFWS